MELAPQLGKARQRQETIYSEIRRRIALLEYQPGQRLSEEVLACEFAISRTPLRRVLARLEDEGLLRSIQSVGTIVTDIDVETLSQTYRLRMELAELLGSLDPVPATDEVIQALRQILARLDRLGSSPEPAVFAQINIDFFHIAMRLTGNQPFREINERLYYRTTRIWIRSLGEIGLAEEISVFRREVSDVLAAVEVGDLRAVGHLRRAHISMSFERLKRLSNEMSERAHAAARSSTGTGTGPRDASEPDQNASDDHTAYTLSKRAGRDDPQYSG